MSERGTHQSSGAPAGEPIPGWLIALAGLTVLLVGAVIVFAVLPALSGDDPETTPTDSEQAAAVQDTVSSDTVPAEAGADGTTTTVEPVLPEGQIAYVTSDRRVLVGDGLEAPVEVARDAALGAAGLGAVALAPTADLVAYVRTDGALVVVPVDGGPPRVLATDVSLEAIGNGSTLSWDPTGFQIAYVAVGTEDMADPRPEEPPALSSPEGVFRVPLPEGVIGDVVRVVDREAVPVTTIGDPSTRSMVSVVSSLSDDLLILESVAPDTLRPYTLALGSSGSPDEVATFLSADDPSFSPDGAFVVAVGPDKTGRELVRITTDTVQRATLTSDEDICNPSVSPDATRIVYGAGENCSQLKLISSRGGAPIDVTPPARPGTATFEYGDLGWTSDGHYITFADCRATDGPVRCGGPVTFFDPDERRVIAGIDATTIVPVRRPLLPDVQLDIIMAGPIEYEASFVIDSEIATETTTVDENTDKIEAEIVDGDRTLSVDLQVQDGAKFATGQITVVDPEAGIDRTFLVLGTPSVIGLRVISLTGMWISTDELPVTSGEFRLAVQRR